jgi:uncharacterized protein YkwD
MLPASFRILFLVAAWVGVLCCLQAGETKDNKDNKDDKEKSANKLNAEEQKILDLTNEARKKEKLTPLKINFTLVKAARAHSKNMAKQRKMDHKLDGKNPGDRLKDAGYRAAYYGENIAFGFRKFGTPEKIFDGWMESKGHRKNILTAAFREIGIGTYTNAAGETYYTQVFGKRLGQP